MNNIKEFREKHNLTQKALAEIIGVCQGTISGWELGKVKPTVRLQLEAESAMKRIEAYQLATMYYDALSRVETKPRFTWKRKLVKLAIAALITTIIVVLY